MNNEVTSALALRVPRSALRTPHFKNVLAWLLCFFVVNSGSVLSERMVNNEG
jgi:hypothetical protein